MILNTHAKMLIDFRAPDGVKSEWFVHAAACAGWREPMIVPRDLPIVKVSLVRHPCDWLADLPEPNRECMMQHPGDVGRLFFGYGAEVYLRIEDCPAAFIGLAVSLGVPRERMTDPLFRELVVGFRSSIAFWGPDRWAKIMEAERELCQHFDYW